MILLFFFIILPFLLVAGFVLFMFMSMNNLFNRDTPTYKRDPSKRWELWLYDISYFSGKLEAYLRYKGIEYNKREPTRTDTVNILMRYTGVAKVPVLHDMEKGLWLKDSTSIIEYLEQQTDLGARCDKVSVMPKDPVQKFFSQLLEDYADEWLWRPAMYFRWAKQSDRAMNVQRFHKEFFGYNQLPKFLTQILLVRRQLREYIWGDGVRDLATKQITEQLYFDTLAQMEAILAERAFLLGDRPTFVDYGFMASMFRHFGTDPTPLRIMRNTAPAVHEWIGRMWNASTLVDKPSDPSTYPAAGTIPKTWYPILKFVGDQYLPYLYENAIACKNNISAFDYKVCGATYRQLPAYPFRAFCRERLQRLYSEIPESSQGVCRQILEETGCWEPLFRDGVIKVDIPDRDEYPVCRERVVPTGVRAARLQAQGSSWGNHDFKLKEQDKKKQ